MQLPERQKNILAAVAELFMQTGEPVGSKAVCDYIGNSCSTATIRNEMAELIEKGFLMQPHTSAGRIPSGAGYRFYLENSLTIEPLDERDKRKIESMMPVFSYDIERFVFDVGTVLANLTNCVSVVTTPYDINTSIKRIELIPMSSRLNVLAVLTSYDVMKSCVCKTDTPIYTDGMEVFIKAANDEFCNIPINSISPAKIQSFISKFAMYSLAFAPLMEALHKVLKEIADPKIKIDGQSNLLFHRDFTTADVRGILGFLSDSDNIAYLLDSSDAEVSVLFGNETDRDAIKDTSLVTAEYYMSDSNSGKIGVLGPIRMDYSRILPTIKYLAHLTEMRVKNSMMSI